MKQGNQFYLEFQLEDENEQLLDISSVQKVQFNIDNLTKTYDGVADEVTYDNENSIFKVWLKEEEHKPYYATVIFLADNFDENKLNDLYVEEDI